MNAKTLSVSAIQKGTVIDHITAGNGLVIVELLKARVGKKQITIGLNLTSPTMGFKDVVKLDDKILIEHEVNQLSIFAPSATISLIDNYAVQKKFKVQIPHILQQSSLCCPNPTCMTNAEEMFTEFKVHQQNHSILLHCRYCERLFSQNDFKGFANR